MPVRRLEEYVSLSSNSHDARGVARVQKRLRRELRRLGLSTVFLRDSKHQHGPLLVAELEGQEDAWITLVCHADTVHSAKDFPSYVIKLDDERSSGPGVIDNKGGIVVIIGLLENIIKTHPYKKDRRLGIRIVCSPNEEIGSPGFHKHFRHFSQSACAILGFEPATPQGSIIGSRQGNRWYNIEIEGQAAHAGRDHQHGVNAGHEIAIKAVAFEDLTDYANGLTVNVGHISAGKPKHNVVAAKAKALVDVRFRSLTQRREAHKKIIDIIDQAQVTNENGVGTQSEWHIVDDCPPFRDGKKSKQLYQLFKGFVEKYEQRTISLTHAGGCADSNHFNRPGMPILDGLGPVGGEMHTDQEWVEISTLESRSQAGADLVVAMMNDQEVTRVPVK